MDRAHDLARPQVHGIVDRTAGAAFAALVAIEDLLAALVFYLLFVVGLLAFVVNPALAAGSWTKALLPGLLFGLITYATYDLTNLATVKDWPVLITVIDLIWGSFVSAATATIGYFIIRLF